MNSVLLMVELIVVVIVSILTCIFNFYDMFVYAICPVTGVATSKSCVYAHMSVYSLYYVSDGCVHSHIFLFLWYVYGVSHVRAEAGTANCDLSHRTFSFKKYDIFVIVWKRIQVFENEYYVRMAVVEIK